MSERLDPEQLRNATSVCEVFQHTSAVWRDAVALRTTDDDVAITWREYGERVRRIATGLYALGVRHGDTVALMMTNRPEFHLVDTAVFHLGAAPFSIYNTNTADQIAYLFDNAENSVVVCEQQFLPRIREVGGSLKQIVCVDGDTPDTTSLAELETTEADDFDFDAAWRAVGPDDVLTLIYTSGTTGPPKGVEITHRNIAFSMGAALETPSIESAVDNGRLISYLPDAHLANRYFAHYMPISTGATVTDVADVKTIAAAIDKVRPTIFLGVPTIWYKLKAAIEQAVAAEQGIKGRLAGWALRTGVAKVERENAGSSVPLGLRARYELARRLVLSKLPAKVGLDACVVPISGAAPIDVAALEFLMAIGIPVCEGWAMSESSVHGTVNHPEAMKPGTVGVPMYGNEVRIADDGELLLRSPAVMKGYRKEPEKTAETIDEDGWLHTGDIATIDSDGYVSIVERKKELIINAAGKNMSPSNIEGAVKVACPLIGNVVAIGDRKPFVVALITLDPDAATAYAREHGLPETADGLASDPRVAEIVRAAVSEANAKLARVEQVKEFTILPTFWEPGSDVLTPTMKLKRKPIEDVYGAEIEALYSGATSKTG